MHTRTHTHTQPGILVPVRTITKLNYQNTQIIVTMYAFNLISMCAHN